MSDRVKMPTTYMVWPVRHLATSTDYPDPPACRLAYFVEREPSELAKSLEVRPEHFRGLRLLLVEQVVEFLRALASARSRSGSPPSSSKKAG